MSDHYRFSFHFGVRFDAPEALHKALTALAEGKEPEEGLTSSLPKLVQDYLHIGGRPGDGVHGYHFRGPKMVHRKGALVEVPWQPHETPYQLSYIWTFQDDEYYNAGMYWPYWLMQFAGPGQLGVMHQINGDDPPVILTKVGDDLIETKLIQNPPVTYTKEGRSKPDPDQPLRISEHRRIDMVQMIKDLDRFFERLNWD